MTEEIVKENNALVIRSPKFVYVAEDGNQGRYDIIGSVETLT